MDDQKPIQVHQPDSENRCAVCSLPKEYWTEYGECPGSQPHEHFLKRFGHVLTRQVENVEREAGEALGEAATRR